MIVVNPNVMTAVPFGISKANITQSSGIYCHSCGALSVQLWIQEASYEKNTTNEDVDMLTVSICHIAVLGF